jgi:GT2 family glycosyltransferase
MAGGWLKSAILATLWPMDLSIVIVTWQSEKEIGPCLRSILACADGLKIEAVVVDNASTDGTRNAIEKLVAGGLGSDVQIKTIWNDKNKGFAAATNQGMEISKGGHVLLLNPDTELVAGALSSTLNYLRAHPDVGIAGCKLLNFDGSLQPSVRRFPTWKDQAVILLKMHNFFPRLVAKYMAADTDYEREQEVDQVRGAFFLLNREFISKIGMLDDRNFFNWFEEVDYCRRAKNSGFKVMYLPFALCRHAGGASFGQELSFKKQRWLTASMKQYFRKHGTLADRFVVSVLTPVSLALAWGVEKAGIKPHKYV